GSDMYPSLVTPDDTLVFINSSSSVTPGQPSQQGLYVIQLDAAKAGAQPAKVDARPNTIQLMADAHTLLYLLAHGTLVYYAIADKTQVQLATNVSSYSLGPVNRGPVAFITQDNSVHLLHALQPTVDTLSVKADANSPLFLSPDGERLYFFQHVD